MATIVNDRDVLIMSAPSRYNPPTDRGMFLTPSTAVFKLAANGQSASPSSFQFVATLLNITGTVTWSASGGIALATNGNTATLDFAGFSAVTGTITATVTVDGQRFTQTATVSKLADGASGPQGSRGNVDIAAVTSGSVWSDSEAAAALAAAGYGTPQVRDMVNLYRSDRTFSAQKMYNGSAWIAVDYVWNGNVFVKGSILPEAIDTRGLTVKDAQGNIILGAGTGLPASSFAGTVGGDNLCPNSSFEVATNGVLGDGWVLYNNQYGGTGEPATTSIAVGGGRTGGNAQLVSWSVKQTTTKGLYLNQAVRNWVPGATYIVSFYAMTTNLSDVCSMFLAWNISPATVVALLQPNLSTAWQRYAFKLTWGANVEAYGRFFVSVTSTNSPGNVWFDDFMITEGDVLPAYYASAMEAKQAADAANAALASIASDSVLSKGEKADIVVRWQACDSEKASLVGQASGLGVDSTSYVNAHGALSSYLIGIPNGWNDSRYDSAIDPTTWRAKWNAYYDQKQKLINALAAAAATTSTWAGVKGPNKPADNASAGSTINGDPNFTDPSLWDVSTNSSGGNLNFNWLASAPGSSYPTCIYPDNNNGAGDAGVWLLERKVYPISASKTYRLAANIFSNAGNTRQFYLAVCFFDINSNLIQTSWGGSWSGYPVSGVPLSNNTFNRYKGDFGANTANAIPAGAVTCRVGIILNYGGPQPSSATGSRMAAQGFTFTDITDGATFGTNVYGQITPANASTYIANAAIGLAHIDRASIGNLSALTATIGLLRTASSGQRIEIADNLIVGYRSNNTLSFKITA